jgi:hypothetical protein
VGRHLFVFYPVWRWSLWLGEGTTITRFHKFAAASTVETKVRFARKKKNSPPPQASTTLTPVLTGSSTHENPITEMTSNVKLSTSWVPVKKQEHFVILTIRNSCSSGPISGTVVFNFDETKVTFSPSQFAAYNPHNPTTNAGVISGPSTNRAWTWAYTNLAAGQQRHIFLLASVKLSSVSGTELPYTATITPSCGESLNSFGYTATVGALAHDPNRKDANKESICEYTDPVRLQYKVNFHNDGDAPATEVLVTDEIEVSQLVFGSMTLDSYSSFCIPNVDPAAPTTYQFQFPNINLPGINETHPFQYTYSETVGEFRFSIQTLPNLSSGAILNQAEVLFDGAGPVATNVAKVLILENTDDNPCVMLDRTNEKQSDVLTNLVVLASPNPFSEQLKIATPILVKNESALLEIMDISGQIRVSQTVFGGSEISIPTAHWPAGLYFVRFQSANEIKVLRVIKQ